MKAPWSLGLSFVHCYMPLLRMEYGHSKHSLNLWCKKEIKKERRKRGRKEGRKEGQVYVFFFSMKAYNVGLWCWC